MAELNPDKSIYGWNKNSLSWSAYSTWIGSKQQYRLRYYHEDRPSFQTAETMFGNKVGDILEEKAKDKNYKFPEGYETLEKVEYHSKPEHRIAVMVGGVKLIGYLDSYDPKQKRFLEYKTSHKNKRTGKHYWDLVKVSKHQQLDFYSLLIQEKYEKVQNKCKLIYMETEESTLTYKGRELELANKGLRLTGEVKNFDRSIEQWERDAMKKRILLVAKEIQEDYEKFQKGKSS